MIRYIRQINNEDDEQLICTGWEMVGLSLWRHEKFGRKNFNTVAALSCDVHNYRIMKIEHHRLLDFVATLAETTDIPFNVSTEANRTLTNLGLNYE